MPSRQGISSIGDIHTTKDNVDWATLWGEFNETIKILNERRTAVMRLFTSSIASAETNLEQSAEGGNDFEAASEYGVPKSIRVSPSVLEMGFPFRWYDMRKGFTWQYLSEVEAGQVEAIHAAVLEADNRLSFRHVMQALLTKTTIATRLVNEHNVPVYPLYDGETDSTPPDFNGETFEAGHDHYIVTNGAFTAPDLDALLRLVTEHGYGLDYGSQMIILVHSDDAEKISRFRATGTDAGAYDFIPATNAPAFLSEQQIIGDRAPGSYEGLKVTGSYGGAFIVVSNWAPKGYVVALASGAQNAPLALREHTRADLRGLKIIPGAKTYPLEDSYYVHGLGVGVRLRGAAAVLQITAEGMDDYTSPVYLSAG
ncbi:MAG: hypothetical protein EOP28_00380 [Rhodococcus sp. (in: high G+C Gram-positive bacteria)]|nr:MAG: hypothetical protein EOP28_00380 [Rhodococcus sp. (in: high G+C Gram-positive bacteria)]